MSTSSASDAAKPTASPTSVEQTMMRNASSSSSTTAKRKMTIKPFKKRPKVPDNFEKGAWDKLKQSIIAIQNNKPIEFSREELYGSVEELCKWKYADQLYRQLQQVCQEHIKKTIQVSLVDKATLDSNLDIIEKVWQDHCDQMMTIRSIFLYLDRTHVVQSPNLRSVWELGLVNFRTELERHVDTVLGKLLTDLLGRIEMERNGETIVRSQLYNLLRMMSALGIYGEKFEIPFIHATRRYYQMEGNRYIEQNTIPVFLLHIERRLQEESERVVHYLEDVTKRSLIATVEETLLKPHIARVLEKESLFHEERVEDISRLYTLFSRVNGLKELKISFGKYISTKGTEIVKDIAQEKRMVERLLLFKEKLNTLTTVSFKNDPAMIQMVKEAMEEAINARESRPAELIAKYVDAKMRTGQKGGSDTQVDACLDQVMVLFRYIQGKDTFEAFYKKALAKRLILGKSASHDLEKSMIAKLKAECGNAFTSKLEGMFKDVELSKGVMAHFRSDAASQSKLQDKPMQMDVQVLTTVYWPTYVPMKVQFPSALAPYQTIFKDFYQSKYQGRQLQWQHSLAHCLVKARFPKGTKELNVSLFQTMVLLCFNNCDSIGFEQIKELTGIEHGELCRTLQSLACGMVRVLKKEPKGREVNPTDTFVFNQTFANERLRIKINSIQLKETVKENKETHERVFQDRQYQVDAAIVRIMKARKQLSHNILMTELYGQLKFPARPVDIKKRIESLIDREYLERDELSAQVYNYLA